MIENKEKSRSRYKRVKSDVSIKNWLSENSSYLSHNNMKVKTVIFLMCVSSSTAFITKHGQLCFLSSCSTTSNQIRIPKTTDKQVAVPFHPSLLPLRSKILEMKETLKKVSLKRKEKIRRKTKNLARSYWLKRIS